MWSIDKIQAHPSWKRGLCCGPMGSGWDEVGSVMRSPFVVGGTGRHDFYVSVISTKIIALLVLTSLSSPHIVSTDPRNGSEVHAMPLDLFSRKLVLLVE